MPRAQRRYNRTWRRASPYLGAEGQPAPLVGFGESDFPGLEGRTYVHHDDDGTRKVFTPDQLRRDLAYKRNNPKRFKKPSRRRRARLRNRLKRQIGEGARGTLLHEWAHVYQDPEVLHEIDAREGGADLFKRNIGREILRRGRHRSGYYPDEHAIDFIRKFGRDAYRREQFGENFGRNPREIRYPGATPSGGSRDKSRALRRVLRRLQKRGGRRSVRRAARALDRPRGRRR